MRRRTGLTAGSAALVLALGVILATASAPSASAVAARPGGSPDRQVWITLITGDRVLADDLNRPGALTVQPAPRPRPITFQELTRHGDRYVVPADAAALVGAGTLDRELFNISGLLRQGYDDQHTKAVPLLMQYTDTTALAHPKVLTGATTRRDLTGIRAKAVDVSKQTTGHAWRQLAGGAGGVQHVWLNRKVRASLDQSVPQIGAPIAWARGLTGKGVTLAVLDTGIDTDNPDLTGRVAVSRDFTGKGSVEDGNGHGTHVASIAAGTGAASGGQYRGVAPDATLAIGKVLDDDGNSTADAILAGMQWAAADAHAQVVNLSLDGGPSDGTDPVSAAVNTLSHDYGTLFVASMGNDGIDGWVPSPAAADAALAVGSVSKADVPSGFSNRGPRAGDGLTKPDLVAPGEGIVAARPDGVQPLGEPIGDAYQRLDGTSMAAPHVAGSAVLLAQQHPDWKADQLKASLMSTADEVSGAGPYVVGTGRVNVGRATGQAVTATGTVSALLRWPNVGRTERRTVEWRNSGTAAVVLSVKSDLAQVAVSADTVTVPAGGSAQVELVITGQDGAAGTHAGVLTATTADGSVRTRTAISVMQEPELYDLTVALRDRTGATPSAGAYPNVQIYNLDDSSISYWGQAGTVRLPAGRYAVHATIETPRPDQEPSYSFISNPELRLDHDVTQTLDARIGRPASVTSDNPQARGGGYDVFVYTKIAGEQYTWASFVSLDPRFHQVFAATVPGVSSPTYAFGQARSASEPMVELFAGGGFEVYADWLPGSPTPAGQVTLPVVYGGQGTPAELAKVDTRGKFVLLDSVEGLADVAKAGARMAMVRLTDGMVLPDATPLPTLAGTGPTVDRFVALVQQGGATVSFTSRPSPGLRYELAYGVQGKVTTDQVYRPKTSQLAAVPTAYYDNAPGATRFLHAATPFFGSTLRVVFTHATHVPQERVEYFTPGTWTLNSSIGGSPPSEDTRTFAAGANARIAWDKAVLGPTFRGTTLTREGDRAWALRQDNTMDVILPLLGDAAGRPRVPMAQEDTGTIALYRDDTLVDTVPVPSAAQFAVPVDEARYRLTARVDRNAGWWPLSTSVAAEWTFRSGAADNGKALPLLTARFDAPVDLRNRAPGGEVVSFPAYVERQGVDAVKVAAFAVDVSYDDGGTWQPAGVTRSGSGWRVTVQHPLNGYASLRATATDADGNTVRQTIVRAYQIGG